MVFDINHILGGIGFRQTHNINAAAHDGFQIRHAVVGLQRVDPHDRFHILIQRMLKRVENQAASGIFFTQDHGVLKVEHQRVGPIDKGIADHGGIGAGNEQHAAPGA